MEQQQQQERHRRRQHFQQDTFVWTLFVFVLSSQSERFKNKRATYKISRLQI